MNISICIATYNGELYIHEQISSIIPQMKNNDELIISDNFSTDNTINIIINNFFDNRIKIFFCNKLGVVNNFENAILNSTKEIICLCDQDDTWLPGRLDAIRNTHCDYDLIIVNGFINDCLGPKIYDSVFQLPNFTETIFKNSILGCSMSFNRSVAGISLPMPKGIPMHDWWIYLISILCFKVFLIRDPLFIYRRHSSNASSTFSFNENSIFKKLLFRLLLLVSLAKLLPKLIFFRLKIYISF
jgi:glycosyltransferase involved in cell wall biosynthesis